jgi:hypothetical protein
VTFSKSDNANRYWLDVFKWDEDREEREWYDHVADTDNPGTISLDTLFLEPGSYRLMGKACGPGYYEKDSGTYLKLTVKSPDVKKDQIKIDVDKTTVATKEELLSRYWLRERNGSSYPHIMIRISR